MTLFKSISPQRSISRWFLISFTCICLVFCIALLPLISYSQKVFSELEIRKSTQHMSFGISQLETTVSSVYNASQCLQHDTRFLPFFYKESSYREIPVLTGTPWHG